MSTGVVAAGAAAVALYVYLKQKGIQDGTAMEPVLPVEACRNAPDHAPSTWGEALFHVKEVLKYMLHETLGRWHTIDLFVGLAYLSHREALEYPAADIAAKGAPVGEVLSISEQLKLMLELQEARRYMLYCKGLKLRREELQLRFWKEHLGADTLTIVKQQPTAGVLRPAYVLVSDSALRCVVLCIRGTHSMKDLFTSLAGAAKPHHVVDPVSGRLVLGYSHLGMLAAARWLARQVTPLLRGALAGNPGYQLRIVGHSMGGGTAALLTMMLRGGLQLQPQVAPRAPAHPADPFHDARCVAIACPSVVTLELAAACRDYVTSIVNGTDIVPTFCADSVDRLREDVMRSSWFSEFSRDMRSGVVRALQGGVRGVGTATQWTSRNILQPAAVPFRACYTTSTTRRTKRRAAATTTAITATIATSMSSPNFAAAEQHEQLLLAAGAGGGAAAAAAAAVASLDGGSGSLSPSTSAAVLAALAGTGPGLPPLPPRAQAMSPAPGQGRHGGAGPGGLDQRAMAEAVQSCMYAVGSAVSAHQHQQQQHTAQSPADSAMAEAMELLGSLPQELAAAGRTSGLHHHHHHHHPHRRSLSHDQPHLPAGGPSRQRGPAGAAGGGGGGGGGDMEGEVERAGDSLMAGGGGGAVLGAGGVSTAMAYGSSLRRRLWPWGQGQDGGGYGGGGGGGAYSDGAAGALSGGATSSSSSLPNATLSGAGGSGQLPISSGAGGGLSASASASGGFGAMGEDDGAGGGIMTPPHLSAPDSPGKAKAAAAVTGGGGLGAGGTFASTRSFGDWLWRGGGMLFTTCTTPRRPTPPGGLPGLTGRGLGLGGRGAVGCGPVAGRAAGGQGPLRMDVGDGFDDESDPEDEEGAAGSGDVSGQEDEQSGSEDGDEDDEEEEDGVGAGPQLGPGPGQLGPRSLSGVPVDNEQQLQAGITAVVAAVTNQASRAAEGPGAMLRDETTRAAEDVLREVSEADAAAAEPTAIRGGATRRRTARRAEAGRSGIAAAAAAATTAATSSRAGGMALGIPPLAGLDEDGDGGGLAAAGDPDDLALGFRGETSEAGGMGGGGLGGTLSPGIDEDDAFGLPLSPGGSAIGSPVGGLPGPSSGEHAVRLYKRRLYPAGRILHLFPSVVTRARQQQQQAAADGDGVNATAAAASTNIGDAAAARSAAAQASYVLYEVRDPQAYSRVRLCRTMVSDHLIPAYLTALDSVMVQLEEQQQLAAREAWDRELERERQQQQQ